MPDLTDMEVIFPHFGNYMERFEDTRGKRRTLYLNHDGTGEYVWKKDELIDLTFPQVLDRMVEEFPDQYAFKYTTLDYTRTYEEFRDDVDTFARALVSMGVKPGSKVALDKSHFKSVPEPPSPKIATHPSPECTGKANPIVPPAPVGIRMAVPEILG